MRKCPYCAREIQDDAINCTYCGRWFTDKKIHNVYTAPSTGKQPYEAVQLELLIKKYRNGIILGLLLEYLAELYWILLKNMYIVPIIPKNITYLFADTSLLLVDFFLAGSGVVIIIYTFKLCGVLGFSFSKRALVAIVNYFLGINILMTVALVVEGNKKLKAFRSKGG